MCMIFESYALCLAMVLVLYFIKGLDKINALQFDSILSSMRIDAGRPSSAEMVVKHIHAVIGLVIDFVVVNFVPVVDAPFWPL